MRLPRAGSRGLRPRRSSIIEEAGASRDRARPIPRRNLRSARPEARRRNAIRAGHREARLPGGTARRHRGISGDRASWAPRPRLTVSGLRIADHTGLTRDERAEVGKRFALCLRRCLRFVDARAATSSQQPSEQNAESDPQGLVRAMRSIVVSHGGFLFSFDTTSALARGRELRQ